MAEERLIEIADVPAPDVGAPCPVVYANERTVLVAYHLPKAESKGIVSGVVVFEGVNSHSFGSPNDEALHGHRLANLGLRPYTFYEVWNSAWVADLCTRNRVHPNHRDSLYADLHHFVFTFHDTTLEVAARSYRSTVEPDEPIDCVSRRLRDKRAWS